MVFEDRVAKYPGRWTMVKSDGTSEVITLVRNDEPTKEGTPINAATLNELSTVAGAINAKEEAVTAAQAATSERAKAEQAATNAANKVKADLKEYSDNAASSAAAAATSESNAKTSETESAKNLQGTKEYFEQVRTITIGAQGWYATPEALKAAVPVGENGWWAVVGTTDTIWTWDSDTNSWKDSIQKADLSDYYTRTQTDQKLTDLNAEVDEKLAGIEPYPVGSIYQSTDPTSPASLFGGTWEQVASERVLMGESSTHAAGTTAEAGLPNITGQVPAAKLWHMGKTWEISGSFAWTNTRPNGNYNSDISSGDSVSSLDFYQADFNASRSNGIYGRSSTVQPAAYYVYIWHRVA